MKPTPSKGLTSECGADRPQDLCLDDAQIDRAFGFRIDILCYEAAFLRITPAREQRDAERQQIEPVDQHRGSELEEVGQKIGREGQQGDEGEKAKVQRGKPSIGFGDQTMLRLLAKPEDGQRQEAQGVGQETRRQVGDRGEQLAFGMDRLVRRHPDFENDQGERDGEYAIGDPDDTAASLSRCFKWPLHRCFPIGTFRKLSMVAAICI